MFELVNRYCDYFESNGCIFCDEYCDSNEEGGCFIDLCYVFDDVN